MSQTIRAVQSAEMTARARFLTWRRQFEAEFFAPLAIDQLRAMLSMMAPEQHAVLRAQDPEAYDKVMQTIGYAPKGD